MGGLLVRVCRCLAIPNGVRTATHFFYLPPYGGCSREQIAKR